MRFGSYMYRVCVLSLLILTAKGKYRQMFHCLSSLASWRVNIHCLMLHVCSKGLCTNAFWAEPIYNHVMLNF